MTVGSYIWALLACQIFDSTIGTWAYAFRLPLPTATAYLLSTSLCDLVFILSNIRSARLQRTELIMLNWLLLSGCAGASLVYVDPIQYDGVRLLKDVARPAMFIMKVAILRLVLYNNEISVQKVKSLGGLLLALSVLQVGMFVVVSKRTGAYAGITPPLNVPLAIAATTGSVTKFAVLLALITLSGKRSFAIAWAIVVVTAAVFGRRVRLLRASILASVVAGSLIGISGSLGPVSDKFINTYEAIRTSWELVSWQGLDIMDANEYIHIATAGRSTEVLAVVSEMKPANYIWGLGPGFTYNLEYNNDYLPESANSHFTPLSLTYKFGAPFAALLLFYAFRGSLRLIRAYSSLGRFAGFGMLTILIQSLFAFNIFVEAFLPFFIAIGMAETLRSQKVLQRQKGSKP